MKQGDTFVLEAAPDYVLGFDVGGTRLKAGAVGRKGKLLATEIIPTGALPDDESFESISAVIETDPKFPQRTSVIWVHEEAPKVLDIRIWERGAGETLGCGTGSAAAAVDYMRRRELGGTIEVKNKGGTVRVTMAKWDDPVDVEGPAEVVYSGIFTLPKEAWQ